MKQSIRRNVFETNSSSTHSLCVTKNNILDQKQDSIYFSIGEFGWECDTLRSPSEKASYLYTAILVCDGMIDCLDSVKSALSNNNIKYKLEEPEYDKKYGDLEYGYIDHSSELYDFLEICNDEDKIMRFLFSSESFILTGNDNCDCDTDINVDYDHEEYYKGN
jgi:hypothetical protein